MWVVLHLETGAMIGQLDMKASAIHSAWERLKDFPAKLC
jgi:hypothetical protein